MQRNDSIIKLPLCWQDALGHTAAPVCCVRSVSIRYCEHSQQQVDNARQSDGHRSVHGSHAAVGGTSTAFTAQVYRAYATYRPCCSTMCRQQGHSTKAYVRCSISLASAE